MEYCCLVTAAAAKSLQSCPTLCDPIDGRPPGSPIPGILQARTLEWVAISFSNAWKWKENIEFAQSCPTRSDPMDCSLPGSSVHGIFQARVLEWGASIDISNSGVFIGQFWWYVFWLLLNAWIQKNEILRCFVTCFDHKLHGLLANVSYIPSSNPQGSSPEPLRPQCTLFSLITIHFSDCHQKNCIKYL